MARLLCSAVAFVTAIAFSGVASAAPAIQKADRIRGTFYGALVADALTLGTHYEYDASKIKKFYGEKKRQEATHESYCRLLSQVAKRHEDQKKATAKVTHSLG